VPIATSFVHVVEAAPLWRRRYGGVIGRTPARVPRQTPPAQTTASANSSG
jgi:hypothetical protein